MLRVVLAATAVLLAAAPAAQAGKPKLPVNAELNRCDGANPEILDCVATILEREDARLNRAYQAALARSKPAGRDALRAAQRQWIKDRDAGCQPEAEGGGAQASIYLTICHADATAARADELEVWGKRRR